MKCRRNGRPSSRLVRAREPRWVDGSSRPWRSAMPIWSTPPTSPTKRISGFQLAVAVYGLELGQHDGGRAYRWGTAATIAAPGRADAAGQRGGRRPPSRGGEHSDTRSAPSAARAFRRFPPCASRQEFVKAHERTVPSQTRRHRLLYQRDRGSAFPACVRRRGNRIQRAGSIAYRGHSSAGHAHWTIFRYS